MAKLTDKQKKKIIADYLECQNYSETGRKNGISRTTVKNIIAADPTTCELLHQKKEENTLDVLSYLDSKAEGIKRLGDYILDERLNPVINKEQLDGLSISQIVTAYGVLTDKMLKSKEISYKSKSNIPNDEREDDNLWSAIAEAVKKDEV